MNKCILLIVAAVAPYGNLGADEWRVREAAQRKLSNTLSASLLPLPSEIEDPEVRRRVWELKEKYAFWQFPVLWEQYLYKNDQTTWFWEFPFEGLSQWSDKAIRMDFDKPANDVFSDIRSVLLEQLEAPWGHMSHMYGPADANELVQMRQHFDFHNKRGQARRAVIGGVYAAFCP